MLFSSNILYRGSGSKNTNLSKKISVSAGLIFAVSLGDRSYADEVFAFDTAFLKVADSSAINLEQFSRGSGALPGTYQSKLYVNDNLMTNVNVEIVSHSDHSTSPCITSNIAENIDLDYSVLPDNFAGNYTTTSGCIDIENLIEGSVVEFDSNEMRLDIYVPQVYMSKVARGYVSPELWDEGVPAFLFGYDISGYSREQNGERSDSLYASLSTGVNIGAWYFRQNGVFNWSEDNGTQYSSIDAYLHRAIPDWQGDVLIGQTSTGGQIFDTVPFKGARFSTNSRMLPGSRRGYAPEIRGIARTSARVTVRQNGFIVYETTVSPGEFLIDDLYPTGYGGNLEVTVSEADGSEQNYSVPYEATARLIRPGNQRFSAVVGQYRNDSLLTNPLLFEGTYERGFTNRITGYSGLQANQDYYAVQAGLALGSFSADITQSHTQLPDGYDNKDGQSYRFTYSKNVTATDSSFSIAAYRYSTDGYMDYQTAMRARDIIQRGGSYDELYRSKNRFTLTASQNLPDYWGQFHISSSFERYWHQAEYFNQYQVGYSNRYKELDYGLNVSRTEDATGVDVTNFELSLSMPLQVPKSLGTPRMRMSLNRDTEGLERQQVTVADSVGEDQAVNYSATMSNSSGGGSSADLHLGYINPLTSMKAGVSVGDNYQSQSAGISGTMVAHSGGVTLTPYYRGQTYALVEAKGAKGANIRGYKNVKVDGNGYALVPYLDPYEMNEVSIDPKGSPEHIEFENTLHAVAPYSNAVVLAKFETKFGMPVLVNSSFNGAPLAFGATVLNDEGSIVGNVGQGSQIFARVDKPEGVLRVSWGLDADSQCEVSYSLSGKSAESEGLKKFSADCTAKY